MMKRDGLDQRVDNIVHQRLDVRKYGQHPGKILLGQGRLVQLETCNALQLQVGGERRAAACQATEA